MLESGYRISDLSNIPVSSGDDKLKNKITLDNTFILSYSHTVYGINYNKQNYKIPLTTLRDDIKSYIGIESIVAPWSEQMKLWHGVWHDTVSRNRSYTYVWQPEDFAHEHYSPEKFSDLENSYFIIRDAPFPYETGDLNNRFDGEKEAVTLDDGTAVSINLPIKTADPYPDSNKIVTKKYIDERLASKRLIEVSTDFTVRDYDCTYVIRSEELIKAEAETKPATLKIRFPESYNSRILHNKLTFDILIEGVKREGVWRPAVEEDVNWEFYLHDGTRVNHVIFNNSANKLPRVNDESLYSNAQYLIFRAESITDHIESEEIIENIAGVDVLTGYSSIARAEVYLLCENLLYRGSALEYVNDETGDILEIVSTDNSVLADTSLTGGTITVDLKTDIRSKDDLVVIDNPTDNEKYWKVSINKTNLPTVENSDNTINVKTDEEGYKISVNRNVVKTVIVPQDDFIIASKDENSDSDIWNLTFDESQIKCRKYLEVIRPSGFIDLTTSYHKQYYSSITNLDLTFDKSLFISGELLEINLLYKPEGDGIITGYLNGALNGSIKWAMNTTSPQFKAGRLYSITFTYIPPIENFTNTAEILGRVNWFRDL